ncbi:MAG: M3 family metallopeptidase [Puniceicoccales bacterium]|nr:M3 family metallopeptidase [Puniceicoccales bacterium]
MDAVRIGRQVMDGIASAQRNIDAICAVAVEDVTFENCIEAIEFATEPLDFPWAVLEHLVAHIGSDELRAIHGETIGPVTEFYGSIAMNGELWKRVLAVRSGRGAKELGAIEKRLLDETTLNFRDGGADLDQDKKTRLLDVRKLLAKATKDFSDRLQSAMDGWEMFVDESQLDGLPQPIVAVAMADGAAKGRSGSCRLTLHAPIYGPAMRHLRSEELRKIFWKAYDSLCSSGENDNGPIILQILRLRREEANLLSYENFADYVLSRRMVKSGKRAQQFTADMHGRVAKQFQWELERLRNFKKNSPYGNGKPLEPWETAFYGEEQCKALHAFDGEQLRPYFQLDDVLGGLFSLAGKLYGLRIVEHETRVGAPDGTSATSVWHSDVRYFTVHESTGEQLGSFYVDLFPREGKRPGAWENVLVTGHADRDGAWVRPIATMSANLTPPTEGQPSRLTHDEVETVFHEFGHLLHSIFGKVKYESLNGTNVAWDFVELPSQLMENWVWEYDCLRTFAIDRSKGDEVLPRELFDRMASARNYQKAMGTMRQLSLQKMDLDLHISYGGTQLDDFIGHSIADYVAKYPTKPRAIVRHFPHLFSDPVGYAASYYSYKWAELLDADAFECFMENGIFNSETANAFRREILERGNGEAADRLYVNFRRREPCVDALLRRDGLLPRTK